MDVAEQRLIDANVLADRLQKLETDIYTEAVREKDPVKACVSGIVEGIKKQVIAAPTIDAKPVVHAENVTPTHSTDMFVCGNCGFTCEITKLIYEDEDHPEVGIPFAFEYDCKYCPDCGAKMDAKDIDVPTKDGGAEC